MYHWVRKRLAQCCVCTQQHQTWVPSQSTHQHSKQRRRCEDDKSSLPSTPQSPIVTHLDVPKAFVDKEMTTVNDSNDFTMATLNVLHNWHTSQSGNCLYFQYQDQLANAFGAAGLDKESVYQAMPKNPEMCKLFSHNYSFSCQITQFQN